VRGKGEKFGEHFAQATLFWNSQTAYEKAHIIRGFRFELSKVTVPAIRERTVAMLRNVADELAQAVADGLGIPLPRAMPRVASLAQPEITTSPALSLTFRPGDGSIRGRKVAVLLATGVDGESVLATESALTAEGAVVRRVAARLVPVITSGGEPLDPDATFENMPSVLFDGVVVPDGERSANELNSLGQAVEFLRDQYRHCKPILLSGAAGDLAMEAGIPVGDDAEWAVVQDAKAFIGALARHRNWDRATDPPVV